MTGKCDLVEVKIKKEFRLSGILIVTDYDFMKFIFSKRSGSNRISTFKIKLDEELREIEYGMFEMPTQLLNLHKGTNTGISTGDYDNEHKILRQKFHQTMTQLSGKDKIDQIIETNCDFVIEKIENSEGYIDPGNTKDYQSVVLGSLQVIS